MMSRSLASSVSFLYNKTLVGSAVEDSLDSKLGDVFALLEDILLVYLFLKVTYREKGDHEVEVGSSD